MPRPSVAAVRITDGIQPSRAVSWNFRFATSTSSFPRSALFTTYTSPISRIPAFIVWPAPTVSTNTMSMPSASRTRTASKVARASPPAWPRVAIDRMKTPGSTPVSAIRIRSPSTAPPVYGDVGSTATTPTFRSRLRYFLTSRLIKELFPTPGGPVNPTTWARPVCGKIRARASVASGSSSSIREMSFAAARLLPASKSSTRSETESCAAPFRAGTASRTFARRLKKRDDVSEGRPGSEGHFDACLLQLRDILLRDDPAACNEDVARLPLLQELHDLGEEGHVSPAQAGEADRIDVLLDCGLDDVLRRLPEARIDDLHPRVAQRPGDDLRPAIVTVQSGFGNEDADLLRDRDHLNRGEAPPRRRRSPASRR